MRHVEPHPVPLLSVDPGKNALGWALFGPTGHLLMCGVARSDTATTPGGDDVAQVARVLLRQLMQALSALPAPRSLVVERMQVYRGPQQKGDPNDLIELSYISGGVQTLPSVWGAERVTLVRPREWKGQVPKDVFQGRIKRSLQEVEQHVLQAALGTVPDGLRHNAWDAVGIGLWAQHRLR